MANSNIRYRANINKYLKEVAELSREDIDEGRILSLEFAKNLKVRSESILSNKKKIFTINFRKKIENDFKEYIKNLFMANGSSIYIWTPRTLSCGIFKIGSVMSINLGFSFDVNGEGIFSILTSDLKDSLVFDFYTGASGGKFLDIDVMGSSWAAVEFNQ